MPFNEDNFLQATELLKAQGLSEDDIFGEVQGLSDEDLDNFSTQILADLSPQQQPQLQQQDQASPVQAAAVGLFESATFGLSDEIAGFLETAKGGFGDFGKRLKENVGLAREAKQAFKTENPTAFTMGEILGFFSPSGPAQLAKGAAKVGAKVGTRLAPKGVQAGAKLTRGQQLQQTGAAAARLGTEGAIAGTAFAGAREGAEVLTGEREAQGIVGDVATEGAISALASPLLGGGLGLIEKGVRSLVARGSAKAVTKVARKASKELDAPGPVADVFDNLEDLGELRAEGLKTANQRVKERVGELSQEAVEKIQTFRAEASDEISQFSQSLTDNAKTLKTAFDASVDELANNVSQQLSQQEVPVDQLLESLETFSRQNKFLRKSLNESYGSFLDDRVLVPANLAKKIDVSEAMESIVERLRQDGTIVNNNVVDDAIKAEGLSREVSDKAKSAVKKIIESGDIDFEEAMDLKKFVGRNADFSDTTDAFTQAYFDLSDILNQADETGMLQKLNDEYAVS